MPYERVEQPLSRSALEDTSVPSPMGIMMAESAEDIFSFVRSPQSHETPGGPELGGGARASGTRGGLGATLSREAGAAVLA
jgi:hypothetical protein